MKKNTKRFVLLAACAVVGGCGQHYVTPAGGVPLVELADTDIATLYEREPASPFPATVAVLRVQDRGYATWTRAGYGPGRYTVVTARDIESDEAFGRMAGLPLVTTIAPVGRILLPATTNSLDDLRTSAAQLRADLLVVYTVDSVFTVDGQPLGPLSTITLGMLPNKKAHVTSTVAGALIDVRTGFVYGTAEATTREEQRANTWSTGEAIDSARLRAEKQAFESFVDEFAKLWGEVLQVHTVTYPTGGVNFKGEPGSAGQDP
jgi:hypothetical protein